MKRGKIPIVFLLLFAVGLLVAAPTVNAADKAHYLRVGTSDKDFVYVQIEGDSVRVAKTSEGLKDAKPIKGRSSRSYKFFSNVKLPLAPRDSKTTYVASFSVRPRGKVTYLYGMANCNLVSDKATWGFQCSMSSVLGDNADKASLVKVVPPAEGKATLTFNNKPGRKKDMGIGVMLGVDGVKVYNVMDGKSRAKAKVTIKDSSGKVVAKVDKTLPDLSYG